LKLNRLENPWGWATWGKEGFSVFWTVFLKTGRAHLTYTRSFSGGLAMEAGGSG
jgi:hypothetical protein